jgi:hypothetical protein
MSEDLVKYESGIKELIEQQKAEIKKFLAPNLTEGEFWMFIQTAKVLDLNPLKREIYAVKYQDKFQIITGYEVYLKRANRSKLLEWWKVEIQKPSADFKTWVGVFTAKRLDWTLEFRWEVPMVECFKSSEKSTPWTTQKEFMLKKTTIGQGLRLLIPEVLAGMPYIAEEMGSQVIENEYTVIPDEQKIEPEPLEQEAKDKIKNDFLDKLMNQLMEIKTIADLEKKYKTSKKSYESSEMKDSILSLFVSRKKHIQIELLAEQTGFNIWEVDLYIEQNPDNEGLRMVIDEALAGNMDAINVLKKRISDDLIIEREKKESESERNNFDSSNEITQEEMDLQEIYETGVE